VRIASHIDLLEQGADLVLTHDASGVVTVPDAALLFRADFQRDGADLVLSNPGAPDMRVPGYFDTAEPAPLVTSEGARLEGSVVARLAGPEAPGQYAQVGPIQGGVPIGQVETLDGEAQVQRADGTLEPLRVGSKVFQNDVVITAEGATCSLTFADGTIFTLASASRMVLDELIYDPDGTDNSASFNLVEGSFVFIAGQVAKTGGMEVNTPTATMGIRGTTVLVDIQTVNGITTVAVSLNTDPDGGVGAIELRDLDGNLIANITNTDTKWIISPPGVEEPIEVSRTPEEFETDGALLNAAAEAFALAVARVAGGDTFVELGTAGIDDDEGAGAGAGEGGGDEGGDDGDDDGAPPPPTGGSDDDEDGDNDSTPVTPDAPPPANAPPAFDDAAFDGDEDTIINGTLTATDPDGDPVTFSLTTGAQNGNVVLTSAGAFFYTPNDDFFGNDSFTVTASDGNGGTATATVALTVNPVNDAPTAEDGTLGMGEDSEGADIDLDTLTDDAEDPDDLIYSNPVITDEGVPGGVSVFLEGSHLFVSPDGAFDELDQNETRSFDVEVTVSDPDGAEVTATVEVTVTGENDAPTLAAGAGDADEDGAPIRIDLTALGDDPDAEDDGNTLDYEIVIGPAEGNGSAAIDAETGELVFDPGTDFQELAGGETTEVEIDVRATDSRGATSATNTVTVTVTGTEDAPEISGDTSGDVEEDGTLAANGSLSASDADDVDDPTFTAQTNTAGTYGSFSLNEEGDWTYDLDNAGAAVQGLDAGDIVTDSFTATATTDDGETVTETVTITIEGANDAPVLDDATVEATRDQTLQRSVTATDADEDASLTYGLPGVEEEEGAFVQTTTHGSVTLYPDGSYEYTPNSGFVGIDSFEVEVSDLTEMTTATITVEVEDDGSGNPDADGLSVEITTEATADTPAGNVDIGLTDAGKTPINIVFALDESGSVGDIDWADRFKQRRRGAGRSGRPVQGCHGRRRRGCRHQLRRCRDGRHSVHAAVLCRDGRLRKPCVQPANDGDRPSLQRRRHVLGGGAVGRTDAFREHQRWRAELSLLRDRWRFVRVGDGARQPQGGGERAVDLRLRHRLCRDDQCRQSAGAGHRAGPHGHATLGGDGGAAGGRAAGHAALQCRARRFHAGAHRGWRERGHRVQRAGCAAGTVGGRAEL
jgi:VCBS repeat-containing protein